VFQLSVVRYLERSGISRFKIGFWIN